MLLFVVVLNEFEREEGVTEKTTEDTKRVAVSRSFAIPHISHLISLVKGEDAGKEYSQTVHVHVGVVPKLIVADYTTVSFKKDLSQLTKE